MTITAPIKGKINEWGAGLTGIADTQSLKALKTDPANLLAPFTRAISIAVPLPASAFETITERPTPIYANVVQTANRILDEIAFKTSNELQTAGYSALPVPASQVLDRKNWQAAISHKAVARMAGLGWQGKNLLLITPDYGARVRLVTVLTDAPLETDNPVKNRCGKCMLCRDACPAGAIRGINTKEHYQSRNEALRFHQCVEKLTLEFAKFDNIEAPICGICINVCPYGRKKIKQRSA